MNVSAASHWRPLVLLRSLRKSAESSTSPKSQRMARKSGGDANGAVTKKKKRNMLYCVAETFIVIYWFFFFLDTQEKLDLLLDGAAGFLPALCKGPGGQRQLGTCPITPPLPITDFTLRPAERLTPVCCPQKFGSNQSKPEFTVDLRGASVEWASKDKSSKKHVIEVAPSCCSCCESWPASAAFCNPEGFPTYLLRSSRRGKAPSC